MIEKRTIERATQGAVFTASFFILAGMSLGAFTQRSRRFIKERADYRSEVSGIKSRPLHCCHISHDKSHPRYNSYDRGFLATDYEHWRFHVLAKGQAGLTGLTEAENNWAIEALWKGIEKFNKGHDRGMISRGTVEYIDRRVVRSVSQFCELNKMPNPLVSLVEQVDCVA